MKYKVNEIFESWQGEGFHSGKRAIFIRLAGCNLKCSFCDTKHEKYIYLSEQGILKEITDKEYQADFIVITGGEPLTQIIEPLVLLLKSEGFKIAIETNGTIIPTDIIKKNCWITMSPKKGWILKKCNELKLLNINNVSLNEYNDVIADHYYIMPMETNGTFNYMSTVSLLKYFGGNKWKMGIQMHKTYKVK